MKNNTIFNTQRTGVKVLFIFGLIESLLVIALNITTLFLLLIRQKKAFQQRKPDRQILMSLSGANILIGVSAFLILVVFLCNNQVPGWLLQFDSYLAGFSVTVSFSHVLVLSAERFCCIKRPFYHRTIQRRRISIGLIFIWFVSILPTIQLYNNRKTFYLILGILIMTSDFFLFVVYLYFFRISRRSVMHLRRNAQDMNILQNATSRVEQRKVTLTCLSIILSYVFCTLPPLVYIVFIKKGDVSIYKGSLVELGMLMLLFSKSLCDPIVYILRNRIYEWLMGNCFS
eukprot:TCONS_00018865-protein